MFIAAWSLNIFYLMTAVDSLSVKLQV